MTHDEPVSKTELDALFLRIARLEDKGRAEAERKQREQREAAMLPAYARAWTAAITWQRNVRNEPEVRRLQRHAVDLAAEEPAITLEWFHPGHRSTQIVSPGGALAHARGRVAVCPPILNVATYVTCLHEQGHLRDNYTNTRKLSREVYAWRWARKHSLVWDDMAQECMKRSLHSYLDQAEEKDIPEVLEAERLLSGLEYRAERQRRLEIELGRRR